MRLHPVFTFWCGALTLALWTVIWTTHFRLKSVEEKVRILTNDIHIRAGWLEEKTKNYP